MTIELANLRDFLVLTTLILSVFVAFLAYRMQNLMVKKSPEASKPWRFFVLASAFFCLSQLLQVVSLTGPLEVADLIVVVKLLKLGCVTLLGAGFYQFVQSV